MCLSIKVNEFPTSSFLILLTLQRQFNSNAVAKELRMLNLEGCVEVTERSIFQAKPSLRSLRSINISHNNQLRVLPVACLCSYYSLQEICARGLKLDENELLFLAKTFPQLTNGTLDLETDIAAGDYFFNAVECVADFEIFEDLFWTFTM